MAGGEDRPEIEVRAGELPETYDAAVAAMRARQVPFFLRGGQLVRVVRRRETASIGGVVRPRGALELVPVDGPAMRLALEESARLVRWNPRTSEFLRASAPPALIEALVATPDRAAWADVVGITDHPLFDPATGNPIEPPYVDPDQSTRAYDLYDHRTGMILDFGGVGWPRTPHAPKHRDAADALGRLRNIFRHMPFSSPEDQAVAISACVTATLSPLLPTRPGHAVDAASPGSGKSLLCNAISIIATGALPATIEWPRDENEAAKRLDAALLGGAALILLDDLQSPLSGAALNQSLTQPVRDIRPLGRSAIVRVPVRSMLLASGNNLVVRGDSGRRWLVCRLDPACEQPEHRAFDQDLLAEVRAERQGLLLACLTMVKAYIDAGRPSTGLPPLGSFETWSRAIRDALVWAGLPDPCRSQARIRDADPERESTLAVFSAWRAVLGDRCTSVAELAGLLGSDPAYRDLREAVELVAGRNGGINARSLGYWLRSRRDLRVGGMQLTASRDSRNATIWNVALL